MNKIYIYNITSKAQSIYDLGIRVPAKSSVCLNKFNNLTEKMIQDSLESGTLFQKINNKILYRTDKNINNAVDTKIEVSTLPTLVNKVTTSAKPVKNFNLENLSFSEEQLNDDEFIKEFLEQEEQMWNNKKIK
jgi:hypothetical protein